MTRRTKVSAAIGAVILTGLLVGGIVGNQASAETPRPRGHLRAILSALDLTEAQKEQVKAILREEQLRRWAAPSGASTWPTSSMPCSLG